MSVVGQWIQVTKLTLPLMKWPSHLHHTDSIWNDPVVDYSGGFSGVFLSYTRYLLPAQKTWDVHPMSVQCWASVADAGQHCTDIECLLGVHHYLIIQQTRNVEPMLVHVPPSWIYYTLWFVVYYNMRRWSNIKTTLGQHLVFFHKKYIIHIYVSTQYEILAQPYSSRNSHSSFTKW